MSPFRNRRQVPDAGEGCGFSVAAAGTPSACAVAASSRPEISKPAANLKPADRRRRLAVVNTGHLSEIETVRAQFGLDRFDVVVRLGAGEAKSGHKERKEELLHLQQIGGKQQIGPLRGARPSALQVFGTRFRVLRCLPSFRNRAPSARRCLPGFRSTPPGPRRCLPRFSDTVSGPRRRLPSFRSTVSGPRRCLPGFRNTVSSASEPDPRLRTAPQKGGSAGGRRARVSRSLCDNDRPPDKCGRRGRRRATPRKRTPRRKTSGMPSPRSRSRK